MGNVRGTDLADAVSFVRENYGRDANERVMVALAPETRQLFEKVREVRWYPLDILCSYLVAAKDALDPQATDFFRRQGRFTAEKRRGGPLVNMVATRALRTRMAPMVFRMFYDIGRLEVIGTSPETAFARIHGFPATPELCERFCGIWEGMAGGKGVRAEETRCVRQGDPFCELRLVYESETA